MLVNVEERVLNNILQIAETKTVGRNEAISWVGGKSHLMKLIAEGKIRARKPSDSQNGKWEIPLSDVLRNAKAV